MAARPCRNVTKDIEKRAAALLEGDAESSRRSRMISTGIHAARAVFRAAPQNDSLRRRCAKPRAASSATPFTAAAPAGSTASSRDNGIAVTAIRAERDVLFEGTGPDPSEENLAPLKKAVTEKKALAGLATDGDADRFGIIDRDGSSSQPNHILGLVFDYLLETRGYKLGASRSVATTHLLDAVAKLHGVKVYETPVGFKYVGPLLREDKIALGGEESAGMTIRGHLPEKDGILACLLVAEMIAARQASIGEQLRDLFRRVGREFWPVRVNLHLPDDAQAQLPARLKGRFQDVRGPPRHENRPHRRLAAYASRMARGF